MSGYYRWGSADDVLLTLALVSPTQLGAIGKIPEVAIRRARALPAGPDLDGWYWTGSAFSATPAWLPMIEVDSAQNPGLYQYLFAQSGITASTLYYVYFRHLSDPVGFDIETHVVTDEIFIPSASPVVPVSPSDTVMGRLAAMEDPDTAVPQAITDAVWNDPLLAHSIPGSTGDALAHWAFGQVGSRQIDVTVQTPGSVPIQGAQVDVYDYSNTHFLTRKYADVNGHVAFALDDGTYNVRLFATSYAFTVPIALVVAADAAVTYLGTPLVIITPPSAPDLCRIYGVIRDAAGRAMAGTCITAWAVIPQVVAGVQDADQIASGVADANGFFEFELVRNTQVRIKCSPIGLDVSRTVPNLPAQDLTTWT